MLLGVILLVLFLGGFNTLAVMIVLGKNPIMGGGYNSHAFMAAANQAVTVWGRVIAVPTTTA